MKSQRRVTAPPQLQVEVVTDSLRPDSSGRPVSIATTPGRGRTAPEPSIKEFRSAPHHGLSGFAQTFLPSALILPELPGVG
jgi:hypothetical protein